MHDRYTERARKALALARQAALRLGHDHVAPEHLLLGLLDEGTSVAARVLRAHGVDADATRARIESRLARGTRTAPLGQVAFTDEARRVLDAALEEAQGFACTNVAPEHLLLGVVRADDGVAADVLRLLGVTLSSARSNVRAILAAAPPAPPVRRTPPGGPPAPRRR